MPRRPCRTFNTDSAFRLRHLLQPLSLRADGRTCSYTSLSAQSTSRMYTRKQKQTYRHPLTLTILTVIFSKIKPIVREVSVGTAAEV
ncbi:unnamed protein product [Enterobius vermicularis]|uniref:Secreted protein n=1 Tax=Enterobius vermicularis TaxID=51028 RepID=A0A0N4UVB3_ENTVE|nr:unnamed protein product [Enterobius vermicularis]